MRRVLAFVLLLLGALATVLAATSVWASRTLLDESGWEQRAAAVADDPAVATAISDAILERIAAAVPAAQRAAAADRGRDGAAASPTCRSPGRGSTAPPRPPCWRSPAASPATT